MTRQMNMLIVGVWLGAAVTGFATVAASFAAGATFACLALWLLTDHRGFRDGGQP